MTGRSLLFLAGAGALLLWPAAALPASSAWERVEGGAVRILVSDMPDEAGRLRGALQIRLEPGWKTYWRDPGDAGVPPSAAFVLRGRELASQMLFPAPERFDDDYSVWAGYDGDVLLPVLMEPGGTELSGTLEAEIFIGICETICIPVQARLSLVLDAPADPREEAELAAAFAALPLPAGPAFGATLAGSEAGRLLVEAAVPDPDGKAELFVAGSEARALGTPERLENADGRVRFAVPILSDSGGETGRLHYTLVTRSGAVSGLLEEGR